MKKFENPTLEVEKFEIVDVIATSGCIDDLCFEDGMQCPNFA